jgi:hypothetical protein
MIMLTGSARWATPEPRPPARLLVGERAEKEESDQRGQHERMKRQVPDDHSVTVEPIEQEERSPEERCEARQCETE